MDADQIELAHYLAPIVVFGVPLLIARIVTYCIERTHA